MNQDMFLRELEELLRDMPEEEREEILQYYRDLFAEAGPEEREEILRRLGDPRRVAEEIREGLKEDPQSGEYTERGYRDERFEDFRAPQKAEKRKNWLLLLVLFLLFGLPAAGTILSAGFSLAAGLFGCIAGILAGLFVLAAGGFIAAAASLVSGILVVIVGIFHLTAPAMGLMLMCIGFMMLAAAMLLAAAAKWGCTTAVPGVLQICRAVVKKLAEWTSAIFRRLFGKGGAAV